MPSRSVTASWAGQSGIDSATISASARSSGEANPTGWPIACMKAVARMPALQLVEERQAEGVAALDVLDQRPRACAHGHERDARAVPYPWPVSRSATAEAMRRSVSKVVSST